MEIFTPAWKSRNSERAMEAAGKRKSINLKI
jgi:hypothetical protein